MAESHIIRRPGAYQDLTGQSFGLLTVIERVNEPGRSKYLCRCKCGGQRVYPIGALRRSKSCGCDRRVLGNEYVEGDGYTEIVVVDKRHGEIGRIKIDAADRSVCEGRLWRVEDGYALNATRHGKVRMHHLLGGKGCDHKNLDRLDNRRENLRPATRCNQSANRRKPNVPCTSAYKGVCWDKASRKWLAKIGHEHKHYTLGYFDGERDAAVAYDEAAKRLHGEFARLNFT